MFIQINYCIKMRIKKKYKRKSKTNVIQLILGRKESKTEF